MSLRLAVTGARGQIARALQEFAAPGLTPVALARPALDLAAPETILPALRAATPDVIVHAAAYTAVDKAESDAETAFAINEAGARAIAEAAAALDTPLIHLSTDYVFDGAKRAPYLETDAPNPINRYGASKLASERAVAAYARSAIIRLSWVHAPYGANFVRTMLRLAIERAEISVVADQIGRPMAAREIAASLIRIARNLADAPTHKQFGLFHLGGADAASWADVAEAAFAASARLGGPSARVRRITTTEYPTPAARPLYGVLDGVKLHAAHGVRLGAWRAGVEDSVTRALAQSEG